MRLSTYFCLFLLLTGLAFAGAADAQRYASISTAIREGQRTCTFTQRIVYEHTNELGQVVRGSNSQRILDRDCIGRQFNGVIVQQNLTYNRANPNAFDGAVVVFRGNGFTAYCRGDRRFAQAFRDGARRGQVYTVRANFGALRPEWTTDIELRNCMLPR